VVIAVLDVICNLMHISCQLSPVVGRLVVLPDCTEASSVSLGGLVGLGLTGVKNFLLFPAGVGMLEGCFLENRD
jgi:hypothetical protein